MAGRLSKKKIGVESNSSGIWQEVTRWAGATGKRNGLLFLRIGCPGQSGTVPLRLGQGESEPMLVLSVNPATESGTMQAKI